MRWLATIAAIASLAAVREAVTHHGPIGDIEQMLEETARGYRFELPE